MRGSVGAFVLVALVTATASFVGCRNEQIAEKNTQQSVQWGQGDMHPFGEEPRALTEEELKELDAAQAYDQEFVDDPEALKAFYSGLKDDPLGALNKIDSAERRGVLRWGREDLRLGELVDNPDSFLDRLARDPGAALGELSDQEQKDLVTRLSAMGKKGLFALAEKGTR